jgi:hypothetical protein
VTISPSGIAAAQVGAQVGTTPDLGTPASATHAEVTNCACHSLIPAVHTGGQAGTICSPCHLIKAPTAPVDMPFTHTGRTGNCTGCHPAGGVIRPTTTSNPNHYGSTTGYPGAGACESCHTFNVLAEPAAPTSLSTTVTVTGTGSHTIEYWGQDVAGNVETPHKSVTFTIGSTNVPTSITIRAWATSTFIGRTVRLDGLVTPESMIGRNIVVYVMKPGKTYWTYSSNRTVYSLSGGPASWMYPYYFRRGLARGYYKFKARCPAPGFATSAGYALSESPIVQIRVR